jgi:hypothetical protein
MMLVYLDRGQWPEGVVVVLRQRARYRAAAEVQIESRLGTSSCQLRWRVVELWTLAAAELLAANDVGLIPWVPLTDLGGPPEPILKQCRERIDQQASPDEHADLLAVTQIMTELRFPEAQLLKILGGDQMMLESTLVQKLIAKKVQQNILSVLKTRLGPVPRDLATALRAINSESKLDKLVKLAASCSDFEAFRTELAS